MKFLLVVPQYLYWHYSLGFIEWTRNIFNFIEFEFHFFSVMDLLKTFFSPFQRLKERYSGSPLDFEAIASVLLVNIIMRLVGVVVRSIILIFAAVVISLSMVLALLLIITWIFLPLILCTLLIGSFISYLKYKP